MTWRAATWMLVLQCVACGGDDDAGSADAGGGEVDAGWSDEPYELCDGSSEMRLAVRAFVSVSQLEGGQAVQFDNGAWFLFVDGRCTYHARPSDEWAPARTGTLSASDADALSSELKMGAWADGGGVWDGQAIHGAAILIENGQVAIECTGGCGSLVPEHVDAVFDAAHDWTEVLWEQGTSLDGPIRITVARQSEPIPKEGPEWELSVDIDEVAEDDADIEIKYGVGKLIEGDDTDVLRDARDRYVSGEFGFPGSYVPFRKAGADEPFYRAYFRDALPFDDADGLAPWYH